jgi:hypothetical protein
VRELLQQESAMWRQEAVQAREAAYIRSAMAPRARSSREEALQPRASGFQRALRAWEEVMGPSHDEQWRVSPAASNDHPDVRGACGSDARIQPVALQLPPAAIDPLEKRKEHQAVIRQAVDAMDDFVQGRASRVQAQAEWTRLADSESQRIATLRGTGQTYANASYATAFPAEPIAALPWHEETGLIR